MCSSALVCSLVYLCVAQRCVSLQSRRVEQLHQTVVTLVVTVQEYSGHDSWLSTVIQSASDPHLP